MGVNGLVSAASCEEAVARVCALMASGYTCLKVKVARRCVCVLLVACRCVRVGVGVGGLQVCVCWCRRLAGVCDCVGGLQVCVVVLVACRGGCGGVGAGVGMGVGVDVDVDVGVCVFGGLQMRVTQNYPESCVCTSYL